MVLYIDHYDSFANTLVDYITHLGHKVMLVKTDEDLPSLADFTHIIIGPGPGHPNELRAHYRVIDYCEQTDTPLLGVCLGHQLIAQYYGSTIVKAPRIFHGRTSLIKPLVSARLYKGHPECFAVTRYHSLIVATVKPPLIISAKTENDEIMAFEHGNLRIFGVQYHPEAYLTDQGLGTLNNFLES